MTRPLWVKVAAEGAGTALLVATVIGSGIMAQNLSPSDIGLQLLYNAAATVAVLFALIKVLGPISGAHFNPVVTAVLVVVDHRTGSRWSGAQVVGYLAAQFAGGLAGAALAHAMFEIPLALSTTLRGGTGQWVAEVVATAGLVGGIVMLIRTKNTAAAPAVVAAWIGAAYWFTSSTSFANPAVTVGRTISDTFAGIAPASAPGFILAQCLGAASGGLVAVFLTRQDSEA